MSKRWGINRLGTKLALSAVIAALAGILLFAGLNYLSYGVLDQILFREDVILAKEKGCIDRLQNYVTSNHLSSGDKEMLDQWARGEKNLLITLYRGDKMLYCNDSKVAVAIPHAEDMILKDGEQSAGAADTQVVEEASSIPWSYGVEFSDGPAQAVISYYFEAGYYTAAIAVNGMLSAALFVVLLFLFIRGKVRYIARLESEINILKGGDLDYHITVKGNDELTSLAAEMDAMRQAVKNRQEMEEEARKANKDLVTAMSHDLRTPLTSLLGYADILKMERFKDEEQRLRCIQALQDKAYQIKDMSDKMFEYFIVYGKDQEELKTEELNGAEFLGQVVEESLFDMENEGFVIERSADNINCRMMADIALVRRVFGNIFSNLLKYADRSRPVQVEYRQKDGTLLIRFTNHLSQGSDRKESSSIGLKTCGKIMSSHGGSFACREEGGLFVTEVVFPVIMIKPAG